MDIVDKMELEWERCYARLRQGEFFRLLESKRLGPAQYRAFLAQSYHNTKENPKLMALFFAHLRTEDTALANRVLKHAAAENGHHELALADYVAAGGSADDLVGSRPLPASDALTGFMVLHIQHRNPLAFLGYLYFLETLPIHAGKTVVGALLAAGVPADAMTFLTEHAEADIVHTKWGKEYLRRFASAEADQEAVLYGLRATAELYATMLQSVLDRSRDWTALPAEKAAAA